VKPLSLCGDLSGGKLVRARSVSAQSVMDHRFGYARMFTVPDGYAEQRDLVRGLFADFG
jgi:hypothetical protein